VPLTAEPQGQETPVSLAAKTKTASSEEIMLIDGLSIPTDGLENDLKVAEIAFNAYNEQAGGKTWDGKDIPPFSEVGDKVRMSWVVRHQGGKRRSMTQPPRSTRSGADGWELRVSRCPNPCRHGGGAKDLLDSCGWPSVQRDNAW
jgi:hypothetical protein